MPFSSVRSLNFCSSAITPRDVAKGWDHNSCNEQDVSKTLTGMAEKMKIPSRMGGQVYRIASKTHHNNVQSHPIQL